MDDHHPTLMIWDTPPTTLMYPPSAPYSLSSGWEKETSTPHTSLYAGCGGVLICIDITSTTLVADDLNVILSRTKRELASNGLKDERVPPVTLVFTKWDLAENMPKPRIYDEIFNRCDTFFGPQGYGSIRVSSQKQANVKKCFELASRNYYQWGMGSGDVLRGAEVLSVKKSGKKRRAKKRKEEAAPEDSSDDEGPPKPKSLFSERAPSTLPPKAGSTSDKTCGESVPGVTPRKRRTGGKKSMVPVTAANPDCSIS